MLTPVSAIFPLGWVLGHAGIRFRHGRDRRWNCLVSNLGWFLQVFGIAPGLRNVEDSASKRERLNRLGKLKYILIFGVLGYGLAFDGNDYR